MVFRVRSPIKVLAGKMRNFQSHPIVYLRNSIGIMTLFCLVLLYVIWSSTGKLDINHFSLIYYCSIVVVAVVVVIIIIIVVYCIVLCG